MKNWNTLLMVRGRIATVSQCRITREGFPGKAQILTGSSSPYLPPARHINDMGQCRFLRNLKTREIVWLNSISIPHQVFPAELRSISAKPDGAYWVKSRAIELG